MRVFVGIKLDEPTVEKIEGVLKPFKKIATPLKWVKPENIHLTLKFIGEVSEQKYAEIERVLSENDLPIPPFVLKIAGVGKFGRNPAIGILWIGVDKGAEIEGLYRWIEAKLQRVKIEPETRPFSPHITVARNKKNFDIKPYLRLLDEYKDHFISGFETRNFQVFKSDLSKWGPTYTLLKEIPLVTA